jgi:hypothetical protein
MYALSGRKSPKSPLNTEITEYDTEITDKTTETNFAFKIQLKENSIKDLFYRDFLLLVLQLLWFKTYPHADAKQIVLLL